MSDPGASWGEEQLPPVVFPSEQQSPFQAADESLVVAQVVPAPPPLWPTFVVVLAAIGGALVVSGVALGVAALIWGGPQVMQSGTAFNDWLKTFLTSPSGLALLVLPGQLTFCAVVLLAAAFSPENPLDRLGLRRGNFPWWTWPLFLLGTPVVGMIMAQLLSRVVAEPSEQLKMLEDLFATHAAGSLVLLLLLISVLPGIVEELLFRGFMQRRLLRRLPAVAAIGITTVFFAAAHMDPMHAIGVVPLGIWLGVLAWRADSIWPAVFGHVGNNGFAIVVSSFADPEAVAQQQASPVMVAAMVAVLLAFVGCVVLVVVRPRQHAPRGDALGPFQA